jgi:hypothetical protein
MSAEILQSTDETQEQKLEVTDKIETKEESKDDSLNRPTSSKKKKRKLKKKKTKKIKKKIIPPFEGSYNGETKDGLRGK